MQTNSADAPPGVAAVIETLRQGMALDKCHKCDCVQMALDAALSICFLENRLRRGVDARAVFQMQMETIAYDLDLVQFGYLDNER